MSYTTINPFDQSPINKYEITADKVLQENLKKCDIAQHAWRFSSIADRKKHVSRLVDLLDIYKLQAAELMAKEMGKPKSQGIAEIEKCQSCCRYYIKNAENLLATQHIEQAEIRYEPLGIILGIMPWNFPFWQVFRFAVPTLLGGNGVFLKHAPNVYGTAELIEQIFTEAGFQELYFNIRLKTKDIGALIEHDLIKGVSLTGSETAGAAVGSQAGLAIKPTVLELGGSNPFIVCEDANLELALDQAELKMVNAGQSCIAPKRFFVHNTLFYDFINKLKQRLEKYEPTNPLEKDCNMGPLARIDLAEKIEAQVQKTLAMGAKAIIPFKRDNALVWPCILTQAPINSPALTEELFGPVYVVQSYASNEEAIASANNSKFGLGASVFTKNNDYKELFASQLNESAVFVNAIVSSDPKLPFGGIKKSGIGRELAKEGILAFQNVKTIRFAN